MKLHMHALIAGLLVGLGTLSTTAASAASMTPANSVFQASGPTNLAAGPISGPCTSTFYGAIDGSGNATIDGTLSEFVGTAHICQVIRGIGQWTLVPTSPTTAEIRNAEVGVPGTLSCFGTVPGTLVNGVFTFNAELESDVGFPCYVQGTLTTTPTVGIQWP
ncbi:hypothetical protein [Stenotrophomonas rhizophila]